MAFNLQNFQFSRGVDSSYAQGQGVTTIMHTYKSSTDTIATITTSGYFPDYIDGDADKVFVNDQIMIIGSDSTALVNIATLAPVTVGVNLLAAGSSLTIGAPVAATDDNGLVIAGNILRAQIANSGRAGILSDTSQTISGTKAFTDGANIYSELYVPDTMRIGDPANATISSFHAIAVPVTWSGTFAVDPTSTIYIEKMVTSAFSIVRVVTPQIVPVAAAVGGLISGGAVIPAGYRPPINVRGQTIVTSNSFLGAGSFTISSAGVFTVSADLGTSGAFAATGNAGFTDILCSYVPA